MRLWRLRSSGDSVAPKDLRRPRVRHHGLTLVALLALILQVASQIAWAYPSPGRTERVSVPATGGQGDGWSPEAVISADGRYTAFISSSRNLVPAGTNGQPQIFVRDLETGAIDLVSIAANGSQAHLGAESPTISADGRFVAFTSFSRLAPGSVGPNNVYVHDRVTKTTELVTVPSTPGKSSFGASNPSISADGRFVAFDSSRTDLVSGIPESPVPPSHIYVRDRVEQKTVLVTVANDGVPTDRSSGFAALNGDGRYVAFYSFADDLGEGDTNAGVDVFMHDRDTDANGVFDEAGATSTERVSVAHDGSEGNGDDTMALPPVLSADGRFIAFTSSASDLVPRDSNGSSDVFVRDLESNTTERVSVTAAGSEAQGGPPVQFDDPPPPASNGPTISADGRFVGFVADSPTLLAGQGSSEQVFVHDRLLGATEMMSRTDDGKASEQAAGSISLSGDGTRLVFASAGANLVPNDTNGGEDVFMRERGNDLAVVELSAERSATGTSVTGSARFAGTVVSTEDPSGDGAALASESGADLTGASLAFRPEQEDTHLRVDVASLPALPRGAGAGLPGVDYTLEANLDGTRYQVRASWAGAGGVPDFSLHECDVVCERVATLAGGLGSSGKRITVAIPFEDLPVCCDKTLSEISVHSAVTAGDGSSTAMDAIELGDVELGKPRVEIAVVQSGTSDTPSFIASDSLDDGRFTWSAEAPTAADPGTFDVLARACLGSNCSPVTTAALATHDPGPDPTTSALPVPEDTPEPITEKAVPRPRTSRLSVAWGGGDPNKHNYVPAFSANGRYVAFSTSATNLVPDGKAGIYVADRITGNVEFIAPSYGGALSDLSTSGRFVAFETSNKLVEDDTNFGGDIYVYDRKSDAFDRISESSDGGEGNLDSYKPSISDNGRYVVFSSFASNLVEDDTNGEGEWWRGEDVFLHDRRTRATTRVSVSETGEQGNLYSSGGVISADGSTIAFISAASNLVAADNNGSIADVFVRDVATGSNELATVSSDGTQTSHSSSSVTPPSLSANGRYVAFDNLGPELVPADYNGNQDVYVRDRVQGITERISVKSSGSEADGQSSFRSELSADGRHVMFDSGADLLSEGPTGFFEIDFNTYAYDRVTGLVERTSVMNSGEEGEEDAFEPTASADGRYVAFEGRASLVPEDSNKFSDIYLRDRGPTVGVGDLLAGFEDRGIEASGWANFSGAEMVEADDPQEISDAIVPEGNDLRHARIAYRPPLDDLIFRLDLYQMPSVPFLVAGSPTALYGWRFTVDGIGYELRATNGQWLTLPVFELYRCSDDGCERITHLEGGYGSAGHDIRIVVPLAEIGAAEGTEIKMVEAFSGVGDTATGALAVADTVEISDTLIPKRTIEAGVVPAGTPRSEVRFDRPVDLAADNSFAAQLDASKLAPGPHDVWVRACMAEDCGAERASIVVPEDGESAVITDVRFTEANATAAQYSDATRFEARLTDDAGDPITGAELSFALTGAESSRSFSATTGEDGIATVTPDMEEEPGSYQLTVRYDGNESHEASANTTGFVVEREDTDLELVVTGKGKSRTLEARLSDQDAASNVVARRTVDFYADGELIGSGTTDEEGVATLPAPPKYRGGRHDFEGRFEGDDYYLGSSDRTTT